MPAMAEDRDSKEQAASGPPTKKKLSLLAILPYVAFGTSLLSLYFSISAPREAARADVIKTEYGLYNDMSHLQLQYPMMEHLLVTYPDVYASMVANARAAVAGSSEADRARKLLEERAVAHYIFVVYEETFFLKQQAEGGESKRLQILTENLDYFDSLMCNPRLRWYWNYWDSNNGGKLGFEFSESLRDHYKEHVLPNCKGVDQDGTGPFPLPERRKQ